MIRPIIIYGNNILRQISGEVPNSFPIEEVVKDLFDTLHDSGGAGISAIQIGVPLRIFVIDVNIDGKQLKEVFINPTIISKSSSTTKCKEGCLSVPNVFIDVERYSSIQVEYYDDKWNKKNKKFKDFESILIQHEIDHLNGILFIDNMI